MFKKYLDKVVKGKDLAEKEMEEAMRLIMEGEFTSEQLAAFLVALRIKGETIDEIPGAARVMREKASTIYSEKDLIDTCGTGGDGSNTFNISTTTALVLAGGGLAVAKHGNRSVSSRSGSADVLEALGINIELEPMAVERCLQETGIGFLFAPVFHQAMKYAVKPRKALALRTIFNILGPLTNPARAEYQILGVFSPYLVRPMAEVLKNLGLKGAMVVHGAGGLDEFSLSGENKVALLQDNKIKYITVSPEDAGLAPAGLDKIKGGNPMYNKDLILSILKGEERGPCRDVVVFNTAAALMISAKADSWSGAGRLAAQIIDSKKPLDKIEELKEFSNSAEVVL